MEAVNDSERRGNQGPSRFDGVVILGLRVGGVHGGGLRLASSQRTTLSVQLTCFAVAGIKDRLDSVTNGIVILGLRVGGGGRRALGRR